MNCQFGYPGVCYTKCIEAPDCFHRKNNQFQLHDIFVLDNYRVTEYTTRYGTRRFDIQKWKGERELKLPIEKEDGTWEVRTFEIQKLNTPRLLFSPTERQIEFHNQTGVTELWRG